MFLLNKANSLASFAKLDALRMALNRLSADVDGSALPPLPQRHRVNTEVLRNLLDSRIKLTRTDDACNVISESSQNSRG